MTLGVNINGLGFVFGLTNATVSVWIGALDCGDFVVPASGSIFVPFADGAGSGTAQGNFTQAYFASLYPNPNIIVGFTYTSQGQLLRPNTPAEAGTRTGPGFGKTRRHHKFAVLLNQAAQGSLSFGGDFNHVKPIQTRGAGDQMLSALQFFTGVYKDTIDDDETLDGMLAWQITRPYPAVIGALGGFVETQDE